MSVSLFRGTLNLRMKLIFHNTYLHFINKENIFKTNNTGQNTIGTNKTDDGKTRNES